MNLPSKNKILAFVISSISVILIISILVPPFSADTIEDQYLEGYGYGYGGCTRTQGYWKNHPDAWPVEEITIGGITYAKQDAIDILKTPVKKDMSVAMFYQLVAAKLNVANWVGSSCIDTTIMDADAWMNAHPVGSGVKADSSAWDIGEPLHDMLDDYNNGELCAPHCN